MEPYTFVFYTILFVSGMTAGILLSRTFQKISANSSLPSVRVGKSNVSGRGVFALKNIQNGTTIERCPVLEVDEQDIGGELLNYVFYGDNEKERLVAMGTGMLFNHSSVPNVAYYLEETPLGPELVIYALRDLRKGEELFYTYGDDWWTSRNIPEIS
ncbi:MAG: SET domain-containing protein-lysine N-methyltransferase [Chlorobium sp.]|nr:SET domain-containing protein-lysine N-methyltransferase [Chlorobium sp.]MCW8815777.1 SET domain-containing protein-lysine N-methyltransferase [Chlorobium sp.]MCW8819200.1 SET domain-containing protein-lysine N-methyltransferase [Ignavibacteriaceae bacterium]